MPDFKILVNRMLLTSNMWLNIALAVTVVLLILAACYFVRKELKGNKDDTK